MPKKICMFLGVNRRWLFLGCCFSFLTIFNWKVLASAGWLNASKEESDPARDKNNRAELSVDDTRRLEHLLLDAINQARLQHGRPTLQWDAVAASSASAHAADMCRTPFFSHVNRSGYGPELRLNQAGSSAAVMENIAAYEAFTSAGQPLGIHNFSRVAMELHDSLMNSQGHRENLLLSEHTHVGVGFSHDPNKGRFIMVEEFLNRYFELQPLRDRLPLGAFALIRGRLLKNARDPYLNVAYQPFPEPPTLELLTDGRAYQSLAVPFLACVLSRVNENQFKGGVTLNYKNRAGLYAIRIWTIVGHASVLANEQLIWVTQDGQGTESATEIERQETRSLPEDIK